MTPEHSDARPESVLPVIPAGGGERELLTAFLDYQRAVARRKAEGLDDEQLRQRLAGHPSPLTIGGVLKHLSWVEIKWAQAVFLGTPYDLIDEPWATARGADPDWEWSTSSDTGEQLLDWYDRAVTSARTAYAGAQSLSTLSRRAGCADPGQPQAEDAARYELRWVLMHLIEEYARHAGHLDLLRELVDGDTGN